MTNYIVEAIGFAGAGLLLLAYFQVSSKRWGSQQVQYQLTNIAAALLLIIYSFTKYAWANVALNAIWLSIGLFALVVIYKKLRK